MHILKIGFGQDFGLNAWVRCAFCDISDQNIRGSPLLPSFSSARGILETQWCRCRQHQPAFHDDLSDARFRLLDWSSGSFQAVLAIQKQMWRYTVTFINHQLTKIRQQESIKSIAIVTWPQESCLGVRPLLDFVPSPSSPPVVPCGRWLHSYPREIITFQPTDNKNINHCKLCSTCHVNSPHHPHNPSSSSSKGKC